MATVAQTGNLTSVSCAYSVQISIKNIDFRENKIKDKKINIDVDLETRNPPTGKSGAILILLLWPTLTDIIYISIPADLAGCSRKSCLY